MAFSLQRQFPATEAARGDWFPAQKDACWVIRETEESKPLMESFAMMLASQQFTLPVFFVAVFAETKPPQLIKELAALHNVSADLVLKSPEKMTRLNALYNQVNNFTLASSQWTMALWGALREDRSPVLKSRYTNAIFPCFLTSLFKLRSSRSKATRREI